MQIAAMPRLPPVRRSTLRTCSTMRAPDAPTGCPSATAPPSTLSRAGSSLPERARRGRARSRQYSVVLPGPQAGDHLRGERLVDLPGVDIVETQAVALQDRRRGVDRAQPHLRRIEPRPLRNRRSGPAAARRCLSTARSDASTSHAAPSVICELLPAVTLPYFRSKNGLQLGEVGGRRVLAHAVVGGVELARLVVAAGRLRRRSGRPSAPPAPCGGSRPRTRPSRRG